MPTYALSYAGVQLIVNFSTLYEQDLMQRKSLVGNESISGEDNQDLLIEQLNNEKVLENIGGIIFVSLLMIVGFGGNSISLFVYLRKYKPSTHRNFVVSLAIVDLATCCVPMPFILVTLRYPITFHNSAECRLLQFVTYFTVIGSALILLTIAAERYRKICVPHGVQLSERMSKYICVLDVMLGIAFAWPAAVLYGNRSFETGVDHIVGTECNVSDDYANTKYPVYFNAFLLFIFFVSLIALSVVYALIGKQILHIRKRISSQNKPNISGRYMVLKTETNVDASSQYSKSENTSSEISNVSAISLEENGEVQHSVENKIKNIVLSEGNNSKKDMKSQEKKIIAVTRVVFIITVVFFCSFLPHLALRLAAFLNKNFEHSLSFSERSAYQTFRWTVFINNMANPIIYGLFDKKFMQEIRLLYRSCLATCLVKNQNRDLG